LVPVDHFFHSQTPVGQLLLSIAPNGVSAADSTEDLLVVSLVAGLQGWEVTTIRSCGLGRHSNTFSTLLVLHLEAGAFWVIRLPWNDAPLGGGWEDFGRITIYTGHRLERSLGNALSRFEGVGIQVGQFEVGGGQSQKWNAGLILVGSLVELVTVRVPGLVSGTEVPILFTAAADVGLVKVGLVLVGVGLLQT